MPLNVVILAAGKGTRMFSSRPKVPHEVAGKPLLAHVVHSARQLKPKKICIVYGHGGEIIPQTFRAPDLIFVKQEPQLGTGHALLQALPHLNKTGLTLVLYGDVPLTTNKTLTWFLAGERNSIGILTTRLDDPSGYGRIIRDAKGTITAIVEERDATVQQLKITEINSGIMAIPNQFLSGLLQKIDNHNAQKEFFLTSIIALARKQNICIYGKQVEHGWETLGVNSKTQLAQLERLHQSLEAHKLLESGVTLLDPTRLDVRGELSCGNDVSIDVNCIFEGVVKLNDGVSIGANCVIKNSIVAAGTKILPFCHIEDAKIGRDCRIGPYARLRPGTAIEAEVHIGNFVEVKNTKIGTKTKANHLSYLGDSLIGRNVNIGAGAITCNYDGANKYQTIIEDDVFIGSDTQLIAPVVVKRGATIGAGTTLTKDAPAGALTLSRTKQVSIKNWKRPAKKKSVVK